MSKQTIKNGLDWKWGKKTANVQRKTWKTRIAQRTSSQEHFKTLKQNSGSLQAKYEDKQCCSEYVICAISYFSQNNSRIIV